MTISPGQRVLNAVKSTFEFPLPYFKDMATIKNLAQSFLSGVWFIQGVPRAVELVKAGVGSAFGWVQVLKPWEKFASAIKDVGTIFEWPEKVVNLWRVKGEWTDREKGNRWKAAYRIASFAQVTLDATILIPFKWKLYDALSWGNWAASLGVTAFGVGIVKDSITSAASAINAVAEGVNRDRSIKFLNKCQKRIDPNGPLTELKTLLAKKEAPSAEELKKINELKTAHRKKSAADVLKVEKRVNSEIDKLKKVGNELRKELAKARQENRNIKAIVALEQKIQENQKNINKKLEKLERMKVWNEQATPVQLDRLRQVVVYKVAKNEVNSANATMDIEKSTVTRWFDTCKAIVIVFTNLIFLGTATVLAPHLGLSALTVGTLFFLGQWTSGIATGIFGLGKTAAMQKYKTNYILPQTQLLRV